MREKGDEAAHLRSELQKASGMEKRKIVGKEIRSSAERRQIVDRKNLRGTEEREPFFSLATLGKNRPRTIKRAPPDRGEKRRCETHEKKGEKRESGSTAQKEGGSLCSCLLEERGFAARRK